MNLDGMNGEWEQERAELNRLARRHELDNHHNAALCPYCTPRSDVIDTVHLARQAAWSAQTFGPGSRNGGVTKHIIKELTTEVHEGEPNEDPAEWIDVIILAFDGAWRSGLSPQQIIDMIKAKQQVNEDRDWPDWRTAERGTAIEHVREGA